MSQDLQGRLLPEWHDPVYMFGNQELLQAQKLALFCSRQCPGNLVLKAYDLARALRDNGTTVISGFHTPVEKECAAHPAAWRPANHHLPGSLHRKHAHAFRMETTH